MRFLFAICVFYCFAFITIHAQNTSTILLKGIIRDIQSGAAVGTDYEITDEAGNKVANAKSHPKTGMYSAALKPGASYTILFNGFDIVKSKQNIVLEPAEKYQEITKDFTVQKLYTGMELYSLKAFEYSGNTLSAEAIQALNDIKEMLKKNRNLSINITLLPDIAPPPVQISAPVIKSKKKGKNEVPVPVASPIQNHNLRNEIEPTLTASRVEAIKSIFTEVKNLDSKLKINTENRNDLKHDTLKNTLIISVGEVKSLFE
jgi:hypothetical protein